MVGIKDRIRMRQCTLIVTHACNLNCTYCYEKCKSNKMMSLETAKKCILKELQYSKEHNYNWLQIIFLGGEPFMNFEVIKDLIEWMQKYERGIIWHAFATTNGTLIKGKIKKWVDNNRRLLLSLSYDGSLDVQNKNRGGEDIDVDFFVKRYPVQSIHMTVTSNALPQLSNSVISLLMKNAKISLTLAYGEHWNQGDSDLYLKHLRDIMNAYLTSYIHLPGLSVLENPLPDIFRTYVSSPIREIRSDKITYDVDGVAYPHHLFSPIVVGDKRAVPLINFDLDKLGGTADVKCHDCPILKLCPTCYGFNYLFRGKTNLRDHFICSMIHAQFLVACEYQMKLSLITKSLCNKDLKELIMNRIKCCSDSSLDEYFVRANKLYTYLNRDDIKKRFVSYETRKGGEK